MNDDMTLDEFGERLSKLQQDQAVPVAELTEAKIYRKTKGPKQEPSRQRMIRLHFETISGREFREKYELPEAWDESHPLLLLLRYWSLEPSEMGKLADPEEGRFEIPIHHGDEPDWDEIEREVQGEGR